MHSNRRTILKTLIVVAFTLGLATVASADAIDFQGGFGGGVSYTPGLGNSLSLTALLNNVFVTSDPFTTFALTAGQVSLITGGATSFSLTGATFGPGGTINITGGVFGLPAGTTLVSGNLIGGSLGLFGSVGFYGGAFQVDYINPTLLANLYPQFSTVSIGPGSVSQVLFNILLVNGSYSGQIGSSNILVEVPEPSSLVLLGSGCLALAALVRWKYSLRRS